MAAYHQQLPRSLEDELRAAAFPIVIRDRDLGVFCGFTRREVLAAIAMHALAGRGHSAAFAADAVAWADELTAELAKPTQPQPRRNP